VMQKARVRLPDGRSVVSMLDADEVVPAGFPPVESGREPVRVGAVAAMVWPAPVSAASVVERLSVQQGVYGVWPYWDRTGPGARS
jgi:hypothetical protein